MPKMPLKACRHRGCARLVRGRLWCEEHAPLHAWVSTQWSSARRGYGAKHRKQRAALLRSKPLCVECEREGRPTLATQADHVVPLSAQGARTASNLQGLCGRHHAMKTAREAAAAKRRRTASG